MDIARKEDGSYDPTQQRINFFEASGVSNCELDQLILADPVFNPREDGDIAISVSCGFKMQIDCSLSLKEQEEILAGKVKDTVHQILCLAAESIDFDNGEFSITDSPVPQLIGTTLLSGENDDLEKESDTKEEESSPT